MSKEKQRLKSIFERRNLALKAFNKWEAEHPRPERDLEQVFASLGTIYDLLPEEARRRNDDPTYLGVQTMRRALRHLK